jgi:hypothetical protein
VNEGILAMFLFAEKFSFFLVFFSFFNH